MMCISPKEVWPFKSIDLEDEARSVVVPCGKCLACLSNKRVDWSFRLEQEYKASKSAMFVTLTYDRQFIPSDFGLSKRDLQLFFKRLRKISNARIRYYAVGEYGSKTMRPHYHILLFNASEISVRKAWLKGIVHVGRVNQASINYTLKYMVQPSPQLFSQRQRPFCVMSRAYGIGLSYMTDAMVSWHRAGGKNYVIKDGVKGRLPRYYRDKIWYDVVERAKVSSASKWLAIRNHRKELRFYVKEFGKDAKAKMVEARNAMFSRVKVKVAFSQKF